ncbi:hypothetical protein [Flammeovirga pacifica]|uniref:Lipoprotein n=1 Tax=Flammeovirga pacifica TaxID=915059 RepID=A0A1S1YYI8_FLAPC|nr:hypothetical protein [Flammeovirga pacifica]OHX66076.1 hypothetical protein NH26_06790 [Flammeovirga pacifica]
MTLHIRIISTLLFSITLLFSCDQKVEKRVMIKKELNSSQDDLLLKNFGDDAVEIKVKDISVNDNNFEITADVTNNDGIKQEKTIELTKDVFMATMDQHTHKTIEFSDEENTFTWQSDEGEEFTPKKGMFISDDGFEKEISEEIEKEYGQPIKNIKTIDVNIENKDVVIKADVILEDGKEVKKTIIKVLDKDFGSEEENVKVKMIQIEGK